MCQTTLKTVWCERYRTIQNLTQSSVSRDQSILPTETTKCQAADISTKYLSFSDYFHAKLKDRLYQYLFLPRFQLQHESLCTNNSESVNHVFKRAIDWKPQRRLPELIPTLHSLVKLQYADLKPSLVGQGNFQLHDNFLKNLLTHQCWHAKSEEQKKRLHQTNERLRQKITTEYRHRYSNLS